MAEIAENRWQDLFDQAISIIDQANAGFPVIDHWSLGGGTALMLQIGHRESFDVDIFLDDPQVLPYLNPDVQGYSLALIPDAYQSDGSRALKIVFGDVGEIDFICAPSLTRQPNVEAVVRGRKILLETSAEILTKKIVYRGASLQPRDMFDVACVLVVDGADRIAEALQPFRDDCRRTLDVARRMNPEFALRIMDSLLVRPQFLAVTGKAQGMTINLLEKVCVD